MRSGTSVPCAGNLPVRLDDPEWVWFIDRGTVNIFVVEFQDGLERAAPQHLLQRESGGLLPAVHTRSRERRRRHLAQPPRQGIARHAPEAAAGVRTVRGAPGGAGGADRYVAACVHRYALAFRGPPPAPDRLGRTRRHRDAGPVRAVGEARCGLGVRPAARRRHVHGDRGPVRSRCGARIGGGRRCR